MKSYSQRRAWADKFLDQQFDILNSYSDVLDFNKVKKRGFTINTAPDYDDQNLEADVIMFGKLRIALRVRRGQSSDFNDIIIRSQIPSGNCTELDKIREGFGDYYLYCWTADGKTITEWILFDLDKFREVMDQCLVTFDHFNDDGTAFNSYSISSMLDSGCCVKTFLDVLT